MAKYIIGAILIILVLGGGYYLLKAKGTGSAPTPTVQQPATDTYATSTFSITYPAGYTADASYIYDQVNPKKPISGVKFTIPGSMATGTNLSSDTYLSVEWLPRAKKCTGDIYLAANVHPHSETFASTTYSVATSSGAAAGNIYEESVYALQGSSPCIAVRYFIHSGNIVNYPAQGEPGAVREFDRAALLSAFDTIRASLLLGTPAPAPTTTP
ncbi:MAG: hypothetical protein AAB480_00450 [Patescibacteria group bacterium]